jgi:hypothetical protein
VKVISLEDEGVQPKTVYVVCEYEDSGDVSPLKFSDDNHKEAAVCYRDHIMGGMAFANLKANGAVGVGVFTLDEMRFSDAAQFAWKSGCTSLIVDYSVEGQEQVWDMQEKPLGRG